MVEPRKWIADQDDLDGPEMDRALKMLGLQDLSQMGAHPFSLACAVAVVIAQRDDPTIPDETWRSIKVRDLDVKDGINPADAGDPTSPASESG